MDVYFVVRIKSNLGRVDYAITTNADGRVVRAEYATADLAESAAGRILDMNPKSTVTVVRWERVKVSE